MFALSVCQFIVTCWRRGGFASCAHGGWNHGLTITIYINGEMSQHKPLGGRNSGNHWNLQKHYLKKKYIHLKSTNISSCKTLSCISFAVHFSNFTRYSGVSASCFSFILLMSQWSLFNKREKNVILERYCTRDEKISTFQMRLENTLILFLGH